MNVNGGNPFVVISPILNGCKDPHIILKCGRRLVGKTKAKKRIMHNKQTALKRLLKNNIVLNFSSYKLSAAEISVINKGLGFVPAHFKPKFDTINKDLLRFERKLQLHYFFKNKSCEEEDSSVTAKPILESNSSWWPRKLNGHITKFCFDIKQSIFALMDKHKVKNNITQAEMAALKKLKNNTKLVIKKADKGGGIAVLDLEQYVNKIDGMLSDFNTYKLTNFDDSYTVKDKADEFIFQLQNSGFLNSRQAKYLTEFIPRCPIFYGLPKVHKKDIPLRPICSQINGPTCRINELVDKYLYIAEHSIPYLLQDTTAYLLLLEKYKRVLPGTILVTLDVSSLYTNIPHIEGVDWVCDHYDDTLPFWGDYCSVLKPIDKETLRVLMLFILQNCTFEFNGKQYTQLYGTTMGAKFSVKFANIYMHKWLTKFIDSYVGVKPSFIARLIDDCFFTWNDSIDELLKFINYLNGCHDSIKFEVTYSAEKVNFLDTVTYITDDTIHTTVYTKPTDKKQYLYFTSSHPKHTTQAIPYSQAIRYRRIIDNDVLLDSELSVLSSRFLNRGYPLELLSSTSARVKLMSRDSVLKYKDKVLKQLSLERFLKGKSFLPLIVPFHQAFASNLLNVVRTYWNVMLSTADDDVIDVFRDEFPQLVFKRGVTLGSILTSTKFKSPLDDLDRETIAVLQDLENLNSTHAMENVVPCGVSNCKCCKHINVTSTMFNSFKNSHFQIDGSFNCNSKDLVYIISCLKCNSLYVGQTTRMLKERLNNHRSDIKLKKATAVGIHFNEPKHSIKDLKITPISDLSDISTHDRIKVELNFMKLFNTFYPSGMNYYPIVDD